MNRLVIIRVGEQHLWQTSKALGLWSSPESHAQHVRHLFVEGYNVIALFVGRGDIPLAATRITGVRERILEDSIFPQSNDLGEFWTFLQFDPTNIMNLEQTNTVTHTSSINHIKYKIGSQIPIPVNIAREFITYFQTMSSILNIPLNNTFIVPQVQNQNPNHNQNNINYII